MHALKCGSEAVFAVLVAESQAQNRTLHDIAHEIADTQHQGSQAYPPT